MKKAIIIVLALALIALIGYSVSRSPKAPSQEGTTESRTYSEKEKADILESLAAQSTSTVPTAAEQQKILESLAGESQTPSGGGTQAPQSDSNGGLSEEEKRKILESLAQ
jgi:uncharacterized protein YpuA (DUF1002 family)